MSLDVSILRAEKLGKTIWEQVKFPKIESHSRIRKKSDLGSRYKEGPHAANGWKFANQSTNIQAKIHPLHSP